MCPGKYVYFEWIIVEDGAKRDEAVMKMLHQFDGILDWEYLFVGPSEGKGHVQRDYGLNYVVINRHFVFLNVDLSFTFEV